MNRQLRFLAVLSLMSFAAASPAKAIDIHNCAPASIKILFYNESDEIELIAKKRIDIAAGGTVTKVSIPGSGTHKVKIFDAGQGDRFLATFRAVDGFASYVLSVDSRGFIAMVTGVGC